MKTILVAGGAGYIGSHMVALLTEKGYDVVVVDNLRTGHWQAVKGARKLYVGDLRDAAFLDQVFSENDIDGVINFAAYSLVGESVTNPLKYYGNNVAGSQSMLTAMKEHGVNKIVFSSTAATYGEPEKQPIEENDRTDPTNPYGATKLAIEGMLKWCDKAYGIHYVALRYFNAAGSNTDVGIGEDDWCVAYGLHPGVLIYNGIPTLDGYLGMYPQEYKDIWCEIEEPAFAGSPSLKEYYTTWGARVCIYSGSDENTYAPLRKLELNDRSLKVNYEPLKALGLKYIISRVEFDNSYEYPLSPVGKYTDESSPYTIYVYEAK